MAPWDRKSDSLETNNTMEIHDGKDTMETILVPFWEESQQTYTNMKVTLDGFQKVPKLKEAKYPSQHFAPP